MHFNRQDFLDFMSCLWLSKCVLLGCQFEDLLIHFVSFRSANQRSPLALRNSIYCDPLVPQQFLPPPLGPSQAPFALAAAAATHSMAAPEGLRPPNPGLRPNNRQRPNRDRVPMPPARVAEE